MSLRDFLAIKFPEWMEHAACAAPQIDPEIFFPHPGKNGERDTAEVRTFCRHCPVVEQCATFALQQGQQHGIWGGLTDITRRRLIRQTREAAS